MGVIRLLLALFVIVAHSETFFGFSFTGGQVAVELFFIISGFYMTMILNEKYVGRGSYLTFIKNRFLKIYPIYWVVLLFTILAFIILLMIFHNDGGFRFYIDNYEMLEIGTLLFLIFSNLAIFTQDMVMFLGVDQLGSLLFTNNFAETNPKLYTGLFIPQAWTLGIELTFYVIAPFIVRKSFFFILVLIVLSLVMRFFIYNNLGLTNDPWTHRFFLSELSLFLFGTLAYRLHQRFVIDKQSVLIGIFLVILLNLFLYEFIYSALVMHNNWFLYILVALAIPYIFQLFKASKIDSFIGDFSYPVYVSHVAIIGFVNFVLRKFGLLNYLAEITFVVSMIFSYILIMVIMNPIEKKRQMNFKRSQNHDNC